MPGRIQSKWWGDQPWRSPPSQAPLWGPRFSLFRIQMASGRAYAHPRWNANAEGPAKKEVGYSSAMLADGTTAVRSVPRGIRHFPPATTAIQRVHDLVRPGKTSDLWTTSALGGHSRRLGHLPVPSALHRTADMAGSTRQIRLVPEPDLICPSMKRAMRHEPPDY